jgi:hypothetical protein
VRERLNPGAKVTFMLETTSDQRVRAKGAYLIDA